MSERLTAGVDGSACGLAPRSHLHILQFYRPHLLLKVVDVELQQQEEQKRSQPGGPGPSGPLLRPGGNARAHYRVWTEVRLTDDGGVLVENVVAAAPWWQDVFRAKIMRYANFLQMCEK